MFFRHLRDHDGCGHGRERFEHGAFGRGRHEHGGFGRWRQGGGFGGREGRMFDTGELRLVILALIAEKPRHGYEVIKALGDRVGNDYSPSPGVVYPTLSLLEDMGYCATSVDEGGRKLYAITPEGQKFLDENKAQVDAIFARFDGGSPSDRAAAGSVMRAMMNLGATVRLRLRGREATREQIQAMADVLDEAAKKIERI